MSILLAIHNIKTSNLFTQLIPYRFNAYSGLVPETNCLSSTGAAVGKEFSTQTPFHISSISETNAKRNKITLLMYVLNTFTNTYMLRDLHHNKMLGIRTYTLDLCCGGVYWLPCTVVCCSCSTVYTSTHTVMLNMLCTHGL